MKKRRLIFIVSVAYMLVGLPISGYWGSRPLKWAAGKDHTLAEAQHTFWFHLARFQTSATGSHLQQIEDEDADAKPEFSAKDWATRETRSRWGASFLFWVFSGFYLHWFLGRIMRGREEF